MKRVEIWLYQTSEPIVHDALNTYTKGPFYCVYCEDEKVVKYPVIHIFRVIEEYGTHGAAQLPIKPSLRDIIDSHLAGKT